MHSRALSEGLDILNEGDAELMAYALYLYAYRGPDVADEILDTAERMRNKPLKKLLLLSLEELKTS